MTSKSPFLIRHACMFPIVCLWRHWILGNVRKTIEGFYGFVELIQRFRILNLKKVAFLGSRRSKGTEARMTVILQTLFSTKCKLLCAKRLEK